MCGIGDRWKCSFARAKTDALGRMAGGIVHDLNNMLVVISGNAELFAESLPPDQRWPGRPA